MKINLTHRLLAGFVVALLLLAANAWVAHNSVQSLIQSGEWVTHTYEVLREVETDVSLAKDVETGTRGYVIARQRAFLEPYQAARLKVKNKLEPLYTMTRDNPAQQKRVMQLAVLIDRKLRYSRRLIDLIDAGKRGEAVALVASGAGKTAMDDVRAKAAEMRAEEEKLLAQRTALSKQDTFRANATIWLAMGINLLLLALVYNGLARAHLQKQELTTALSELKRLEAMRDNLNTMLVHDLRTPLTTILGPLEMLQDEEFGHLEVTQQEIVGMSLMSSRRLLGLVNELLDVSKMEAGEMQVRRESLRPEIVIDESIKHISLAKYDGAAYIERDTPQELPLLQADQELLTRVLINLLGNAVKFTPSKGKITLGASECVPLQVLPARLQPAPNQRKDERFTIPSLLFCVVDSGEGIPAAYLDRIFEKFGQVETRKSGHKMSSGLGLTFCKLAVEAHGGLIWVESEPGQGSTFYFTIPLRSMLDNPEEANSSAAAAAVT